MATIFLVEDDARLVREAQTSLVEKGYSFKELDLSQAYGDKDKSNALQYWEGLGIKPDDVVVLDFNLKQKGVKYSGIDVLQFIDREKGRKQLQGLERVLVATSMKGQLDSPEVCITSTLPPALSVYGMEKATDAKREVNPVGYANSLCNALDRIYRGAERPLNEEIR